MPRALAWELTGPGAMRGATLCRVSLEIQLPFQGLRLQAVVQNSSSIQRRRKASRTRAPWSPETHSWARSPLWWGTACCLQSLRVCGGGTEWRRL